MTRIPRRLSFLMLLLLVTACRGERQSSPAEDASPDGPGIMGVLVGENGEGLSYVSVMACTREVCFYTDSDSVGRFRFLLDAPGNFLIKTAEDLASDPRRTSPMAPVSVVGDEMVDLGDVVAPTLPEDTPVGADGVVEAGDGLTLSFDPARQDVPPAVAARRIPASMIPPYLASAGGEVIAVYALHPFAWKTGIPIGVRVELDPGTPVVFRTIDDIDGGFSEPVPGRTNGDSVATREGAGITALTHLVVFAAE